MALAVMISRHEPAHLPARAGHVYETRRDHIPTRISHSRSSTSFSMSCSSPPPGCSERLLPVVADRYDGGVGR